MALFLVRVYFHVFSNIKFDRHAAVVIFKRLEIVVFLLHFFNSIFKIEFDMI